MRHSGRGVTASQHRVFSSAFPGCKDGLFHGGLLRKPLPEAMTEAEQRAEEVSPQSMRFSEYLVILQSSRFPL